MHGDPKNLKENNKNFAYICDMLETQSSHLLYESKIYFLSKPQGDSEAQIEQCR